MIIKPNKHNSNKDWSWKDQESPKSRIKYKKKRRGKKRKKSSFYSSWEWKKVRFKVIERYGAICMCCNSTENIVVDHIKPVSRFPHLRLVFDNLQVLCRDCNMGKSSDSFTDFRPDSMELKRQRDMIEEKVNDELDKQQLRNIVNIFR